MDDRPLGGGGEYNINWDEIDEQSNPFGAVNSKTFPRSPTKVTSHGDGPNETAGSPHSKPNGILPEDDSSQSHLQHSGTQLVNGKVNGNQGPDVIKDSPAVLNETYHTGAKDELSSESVHSNGPPSADQLTAALERVVMSNKEESDDRGYDSHDASGEQLSIPEQDDCSTAAASLNPNQQLMRIDSSTRPASPAQNSLLTRPKMTDSSIDSLRAGVPVTEAEVLALRKEREDLLNTVDEMRRCIAEYDRSLQHLIEEKSQSQAQVNVSVADLMAERDQAVEEVATIEKAFGDLHRRFEKSKQVIECLKQNEEALKRSNNEYKNLLQRQEEKYLVLKKHAEEKLLKVSQENEAAMQEAETSAARLRASLRMVELQNKSLEAQLEQKQRENAELTKICEELLNKYSGSV